MTKLLTVFGATGNQGGSVIDVVLNDPQLSTEYRIRAVTRNASSASSQALQERGVEVVEADASDVESLAKAVAGSYAVYAVTFTDYGAADQYAYEVSMGRAQADACVAAGGIELVIFSTLPSVVRNSGGRYSMASFDAKADVEQYLRTLPLRTAFWAPASFMSNFKDVMAPRPSRTEEGVWEISMCVTPQTELPLVDIAADTGKWIAAMLADPKAFDGQVVAGAVALYDLDTVCRLMSEATGKTVKYNQLPVEVFRSFLPPGAAQPVSDMLCYFQDFGYYGENTRDKVQQGAHKARGKLVSLEDWLVANKLPL